MTTRHLRQVESGLRHHAYLWRTALHLGIIWISSNKTATDAIAHVLTSDWVPQWHDNSDGAVPTKDVEAVDTCDILTSDASCNNVD